MVIERVALVQYSLVWQPILISPLSILARISIIFGTGKFLDEKDNEDQATQSGYGIIDDLSVTKDLTAKTESPMTEVDLLEQVITDTNSVRVTTAYGLASKNKGWKFDLSQGTGERVIYQPVVWGNTLFLTSQIVFTNTGKCSTSSVGGYLLVVDAKTGGVPNKQSAHLKHFD